jgi:hypothetical protein
VRFLAMERKEPTQEPCHGSRIVRGQDDRCEIRDS